MDKHPKGFFVRHFGLRGVALFEAAKGLLAILGAIWVMTLRHKDMKEVAENLLTELHRILHINPDWRLFQMMLRSLGGITPRGLRVLALLILIYAAIRFAEASGLWLEKEWAEWFALLSGALYTPFLIYGLFHHPTGFKWLALLLNLLMMVYLAWLLRDSHQRRNLARQEIAPGAKD
jgi:uncharacterized membrane protein (DUF2068 family)